MRIDELRKNWDIDACPKQIDHSVWLVKDTYILKEYRDLKALQRNMQMLRVLQAEDIPVPRICPLTDGRDFYEKDGKMYILTTRLKGQNISDISEITDTEWFYRFGQIIAGLHAAFRKCEEKISFWDNSLLDEMKGWVTINLELYNQGYVSEADSTETITQLAEIYQELPRQLIHRDVHLGNFLFDEMQFSGYIDFDLSQRNIRIFDICHFLLGLLTSKDGRIIEKADWLICVGQVVRGYDSISGLIMAERNAIPCVMKNIELLFSAYFMGIGETDRAKGAAALFDFVRGNETEILKAVMG